jgi:ADP-ribose pyrophosphatase YjhB (NUDIX family)
MASTSEHESCWPRLGVSTAVFRGNTVLLGERAKGALAGFWSLPGGHVEPGEPALEADILGLVDLHEVIRRSVGGDVSWHYVIAVHYGVWRSGEPVAASDCREARFIALGDLGSVPLTEGAEALIRRAARLIEAGRAISG